MFKSLLVLFSCCVLLCVSRVPVKQVKCERANEHFECGSACDNVCADLLKQNKTNCPIKNIICNSKCYCDDGFARDGQRNCIPIANCGNSCGENEVYTDCKRSCPPETCISLEARFKCDSKELFQRGCSCMPGYLRKDDNSPCLPLCECSEMKNSPDCLKSSQ